MVAKTNTSGTLADLFQIGKGGPAIRQGSSSPVDAVGQNGDLYIRSGAAPATYVRVGGVWRTLTPDALARSGGTISGDLAVMGTLATSSLTHYGLALTAGSNIDQIVDATTSLTLSQGWQTAWSPTLADGSYWLQIRVVNPTTGRSDVSTGVMSWFPTGTDNTTDGRTEEITLHRSALATAGNALYARVISKSAAPRALQLSDAVTDTQASNITIRVRRIL